MATGLLVQPCSTADDLVALCLGYARPIVLDFNLIPARGLADVQFYLRIRPFAGVVQ